MSKDQSWRLRLDLAEHADLDGLIGLVRERPGGFQDEAPAVLNDDVVLTHDGSTFFAYSASRDSLNGARAAIEFRLRQDHKTGTVKVSHWDDASRRWLQIDPPLTAAQEQDALAADRKADAETDPTRETHTVMSVVGKLIRKSFERQMGNFAHDLGLECVIVEHPHLLSTQVAFRVTGAASVVEEFDRYLKAEAKATSRIDPGLIPFGGP